MAAALAFLGLGIAQSFGQAAQQKALNAWQAAQFQAVKANALAAYATQAFQVRSRTSQERTQIAEEMVGIFREEVQRAGRVANVAGASNVAGTSVAEARLEVERGAADRRRQLAVLQDFRERAAELELASLGQSVKGSILSALPGPTVTPTFLGTLLGGAAGGLQMAAAFNELGGLSGIAGDFDFFGSGPDLIGPPAPQG